jgi:beta-lactamase regulating signal transducer with metallopeptidase domain
MDSHLIFEWTMRAAVLLAVALPVARLWERRSATAAHRLLASVFLCLLVVLPAVMAATPGWKWEVSFWKDSRPSALSIDSAGVTQPPFSVADGSAFVATQQIPGSAAVESAEAIAAYEDANRVTPIAGEAHPQDGVATLASGSPAHSGADPNGSARSTGHARSSAWWQLAVFMWLVIAGLLAARVAFSVWRLRTAIAVCKPASSNFADEVRSVSRQYGLARPPRVLLSKRGSMPMACWLGRWAIVVPEDIESWPLELQQVTLLHELGHIARRDALVDYLAQTVACLMWPNPLAWIAASDARRLRERACDEWSLARYREGAKSYALNLMEIVRRCQQQELRAACAMADKRDLESRLKWLFSYAGTNANKSFLRLPVAVMTVGIAIAIATAGPADVSRRESQVSAIESLPVTLTSEPAPNQPAISVSGTVRDAAGRPLAGATVVLRANLGGVQYAMGLQHARDVLARTKTDDLGRYKFSGVGLPPRLVDAIDELRRGKPGAQVLAWADGAGLQWKPLSSLEEANIDFSLDDQAEVTGTASDADGEPLEAGFLTVVGFTKATDTMDGFLKDPGDLNTIRSEAQFTAPIREGRFSLAHMPQDYRVSVRLESQSGHRAFFVIDTGAGDLKEINYRNGGRESIPVHRTPIHVTAEQKPFVRIRVIGQQGEPVSGGGVEAIDSERHYGGSAAVDSEGNALLIVNSPGLHDVYFASDPLSPAVGVVQEINIQPDGGEVVELKLPASRTLRGRVIDSDTGAPVPGVYVSGGSNNTSETKPRAAGSMAISGVDGRFELPVTQGVCKLSFRHEVDGYFVPTYAAHRDAGPKPSYPTVTVANEGPIDEVVVEIGRGLVVKGKVVDEQDRPVRGVQVVASSEGAPYRQMATVTDAEGAYRFAGLSPYVPTRIAAWSESGVAETIIALSEDHPWEKTLTKSVVLKLRSGGTSVVGRVTRAGRPVSGVSVRLLRSGPPAAGEEGVRFSLSAQAVTDAEGKYQLAGLTKGDRYYVDVDPQQDAEVRDWQYTMPYSHTVGVENGETIELPDAELKSNAQTLMGVVVDPDGKPVEGITVSARLASGGYLSRPQNGPPPWTKTNGQGRFKLTHLPDDSISLMAYKGNPAGGRIRHPSHATPEMNASDIRIVFDPTLLEEPEDLD